MWRVGIVGVVLRVARSSVGGDTASFELGVACSGDGAAGDGSCDSGAGEDPSDEALIGLYSGRAKSWEVCVRLIYGVIAHATVVPEVARRLKTTHGRPLSGSSPGYVALVDAGTRRSMS